jgi:hypothetical protein
MFRHCSVLAPLTVLFVWHADGMPEDGYLTVTGRLGTPAHGPLALPPLCAGHHHVDIAAAAVRAHQPIAPLGNGCLGAVSSGDLRRIRLGPVAARLAPGYKSDAGRSSVAEGHRWAGWGLLPPLSARRVVSAWLSSAVVHICLGGRGGALSPVT